MKFFFASLMALWVGIASGQPAVTKDTTITINPSGVQSCPQSNGPLTVPVSSPRTSIKSPAFFFLDATGTTDSSLPANFTPFTDVIFTWNFQDPNPSGTGTWAYGSNPGVNSRNFATGGMAGHLYIIPPGGGDKTFTPTVTAKDASGNTVTCTFTVQVLDPNGVNGYPGNSTTCVGATVLPVQGAGGCPAGAAVLLQANYKNALTSNLGNGKRVLFKCGDTFTGTDYTYTTHDGSIGAYGGCEGTQTNRPIFNTSTTSGGAILVNQQAAPSAGDLRIADIDFQGAGTGGGTINSGGVCCHPSYQVTLSNLNSNGNSAGYSFQQGAQWAEVEVVQLNARTIATFINFGENNPPYTGSTVNNLDYFAMIGSHISGCGNSCGGGTEDVRVSACRFCLFEYTDMWNSNNVGSELKLHNGNTTASCCIGSGCAPPCPINATFVNANCWTGIFSENIMITDDDFGPNGGGSGPEFAPQNSGCDERIRNVVFARNSIHSTPSANEGPMSWFTGQNVAVYDNVCNIGTVAGASFNGWCYQPLSRQSSGLTAPSNPWPAQYHRYYNNTCYFPNSSASQFCFNIQQSANQGPLIANSFFANTMVYSVGRSMTPIVTGGVGNVYGPVSANTSVSPGFTNPSGTLTQMRDFKPTVAAAYQGGAAQPQNPTDGLLVPWTAPQDLGAVNH